MDRDFTLRACVLILIPAFNEESSIERCIKSVLRQSFQDFIIVCQDNQSSDRTFEILEDLRKSDDRLVLLSTQSHLHITMNWLTLSKTALAEVSSEYVVFLSADDYWLEKDHLLNLWNKIELSTFDSISPKFELSNDEFLNVDTSIPINRFESPIRIFRIISFLKSWNNTHLVYSLTKRSLFVSLIEEKDSAPTISLGSDWWWAFKIIEKSPTTSISSSTYVRNRIKRDHDYKKIQDSSKGKSSTDFYKAKKFAKNVIKSSFYQYRILFKNDFERKLKSKSFVIIFLKAYFILAGFSKIIPEILNMYRFFKSGKIRI
jgi:glycosyltransferase involved in cell wall biosynthesis